MDVFSFGNEDAPNILIQPVDDHDLAAVENEVKEIRGQTDIGFRLIAVKAADWNHDLSPWKAPAVFGSEGFGGGADSTLNEILDLCTESDRAWFIGGYSLAGLFALWAACRTGRFSGVASASPSVWFPGFTEYLRTNPVRSGTVYLSLGDREEKTKNPVMATVGRCIRETENILRNQGVRSVLEWNPGNHFRDADLRTARAFAWVLNTAGKRI